MTDVTDNHDPQRWLEDWHGPQAMEWVETQNRRTLDRLEGDPRYGTLFDEALAIASAKDRIAMPARIFGRIYNFWRDADRPQGVWRWTTEESYTTDDPQWTVALDLDALSAAESRQWVWMGAIMRTARDRRCLVILSDGGQDAVVYREFDLESATFVADGFVLPTSKQGAAWIDDDTLIVSRDWGGGSMTASGYPYIVKVWHRGDPLEHATEIARGHADDQLGTYPVILRDGAGAEIVLVMRRRTFFTAETMAWSAGRGIVPLPIPPRTFPVGMVAGRVLFQTDDGWGDIPAGGLAAAALAEVETGAAVPTLVFAPGDRQALSGVATTRDHVVVLYTDNVRSRVAIHTPGADGWTERSLPVEDNLNFGITGTSIDDNRAWLIATGFLTPTTLATIDIGRDAAPVPVKALPARFDAGGLVVEQHHATSPDGTEIPYFIIRRADDPLDGSTPTLLNAYGGFQIAQLPSYSGIRGKLWLERGGAYVVANIRGGGEFGPAWHDIGRKTGRQRIFDDFTAVAHDLFDRGFTSPRRLGIVGGSNGGLLMGVQLTQHPELWGAVVIQVPLLDMLRFESIAAGPSWIDEYGSVAVPEERAFLAAISPLHNLRAGTAYPEPFIWTSTKDDRVGPQHARKFAARMHKLDLPCLFYEDTSGGHGGDADIAQVAHIQALETVYFSTRLIDPAPG